MKKLYYIICGLGMFLSACQNEEADRPADPAQQIYLCATVENAIPMTRAPFDQLAPNERNPLKAAVWASTRAGEFKDSNKNGSAGDGYVVELHTKANFTNGTGQLLYDAVYPKPTSGDVAGDPVYFVGMHPVGMNPETAWTTDDTGTIAIKTFDGSEDVMFAPQIKGEYSGNVEAGTWPTFEFRHLLTWLTVTVIAESEVVADAWGKLVSLKIKAKDNDANKIVGNTVTIKLSYNPDDPDPDARILENSVTFSDGTNVSGEEVTFDFYKIGTNDKFQFPDAAKGYPIPWTEKEEAAYVLCPPVRASKIKSDGEETLTDEYILIVETEQRTIEVPVDLMEWDESTKKLICFEGSTRSRHFTLNLNFKMGNNIMLTSSAVDWAIGGISSGVVNPEEGN